MIINEQNIFSDVCSYLMPCAVCVKPTDIEVISEQYCECVDEFTNETYCETMNPQVILSIKKPTRGNKQFMKAVSKLSDVLYMKYNGAMLKLNY